MLTALLQRQKKAKTIALSLAGMLTFGSMAAHAENETAPPRETDPKFSEEEVYAAASEFFGGTAEGLAEVVHRIFSENGEPNAYIQGEEGSGAIVIGARYGDGTLVTKAGPTARVFWQGPSAGWDFGGDAAKTFTLVYNLPDTDAIYQRFPGVSGSAFFIGGIGANYQQRGDIILVPMRAGVGLRLGANVGYLNYTRERDWLPF
ncbi:DUF1134 domain-containing protein [Parvibaculaceae bacterium PLY_AMNH_Bact1]|nr:DUF1134 domain-containing protein [Parvibaculaceae bacterium PLY_AMNH_Bact1]